MDEHAWHIKSIEILTEIKAWRQTHPSATFVEIEEEVHACLMELEAHALQDAASISKNREWGNSTILPLRCSPPARFRCRHVHVSLASLSLLSRWDQVSHEAKQYEKN